MDNPCKELYIYEPFRGHTAPYITGETYVCVEVLHSRHTIGYTEGTVCVALNPKRLRTLQGPSRQGYVGEENFGNCAMWVRDKPLTMEEML